jgi:hypothetical protein
VKLLTASKAFPSSTASRQAKQLGKHLLTCWPGLGNITNDKSYLLIICDSAASQNFPFVTNICSEVPPSSASLENARRPWLGPVWAQASPALLLSTLQGWPSGGGPCLFLKSPAFSLGFVLCFLSRVPELELFSHLHGPVCTHCEEGRKTENKRAQEPGFQ